MPDKKYKCSVCGRKRTEKQFGYFKQKTGKKQRRGQCNSCRSALSIYRRYGIQEDWYKTQLARQESRCGICGKKEVSKPSTGTKSKRRLSIDHCHKNNVVRGLLCSKCNSILGLASDSVTVLLNAVRYLENGGCV